MVDWLLDCFFTKEELWVRRELWREACDAKKLRETWHLKSKKAILDKLANNMLVRVEHAKQDDRSSIEERQRQQSFSWLLRINYLQ
jgi:hypothetical protein